MIPERSYSTACMASRRPVMHSQCPVFFRCARCGAVSASYGAGAEGVPCRCGEVQKRLSFSSGEEGGDHGLSYVVFGGMEHNAIRVVVDMGAHPMTKEHGIGWIALFTYEGLQMKFLGGSRTSSVTFALAGEDAYSFCNRQICRMGREHCQFKCKRGWQIYGWCTVHGLYRLVL